MLRPEQMSKVSVTGSKRVMDDVIETVHDLHLLHVTEYDDTWEGFSPGDPFEGAEETSEKLVTVRSLESILDVDDEEADRTHLVTDEALETELAELRERVNELDDRRSEVRDDLRDVEERIEAVEPFARLGIDLDLLSGYDSLQVAVGEGDSDSVERAVADSETFEEYEVFENEGVVAVFARPTPGADEDALSDALVGARFAALSVPDADSSPEEYVRTLEHERQQLQSRLEDVTEELREVELEAAGFLLAAEEKLTIEVQKQEAPLSFATTENAFVAEGWIPTARYSEFAAALQETVGEHVDVEELERASFKSRSHETVRERPTGESAAATDGGTVTMQHDDPPVVQQNPDAVKPFEVLVQAVSRPQYREFDPTIFLFLTFPAFFGFMIGDLGYGILYTAIGYYLYSNFDSPAFKSMGGVTIFAGVFTMLFGILYGEIFGLHLITQYLWEGALGLGHPPLEKGLSPAAQSWALAWLTVSVLVGILHLNIGWTLDFAENLEFHDFKHAMLESGSWLLMMNGLWVWVFSRHVTGPKPPFLFTVFDGTGAAPEAQGEFMHAAFALGFNGFPAVVGYVGLIALALGAVLLIVGEPAELPEIFNVLVNVLSYTRLAAVLLAKAGMAFTVNLLVFGAYQHHGEFHFLLNHGPEYVAAEYGAEANLLFPGLTHSGIGGVIGGLLVLVLGHALVLVLGITSAGLQAVRLEYVEFFGKFYEGGGNEYDPFGYERTYTTQD